MDMREAACADLYFVRLRELWCDRTRTGTDFSQRILSLSVLDLLHWARVQVMVKMMDFLSRFAFATASLVLMAMSLALVGFAIAELYGAAARSSGEFGDALLGAIGYVVIAVAVFDVAKYFFEEEVIRGREMRIASEARRSLTKFISTISIAVFIEGLVTVVRVSKQDVIRCSTLRCSC